MPQYSYEAIDPQGKTVRGSVAGAGLSETGATLRGQGFIITSLKEQASLEEETKDLPAPSISINDLLIRISRVKQSDVVLLLRQLAALITAGVSIMVSLSILENQSSNRRLKFILASLRQDVEAGNSLSDAMKQFPKTFPPMVTNVLKTGETSGLLDISMDRVATYWEEKLVLRQQLITSMMYPVIILLVAMGVMLFILSYVLPNMVPFLETMGGELPATTRFLIFLSDSVSANLGRIGMALGLLVAIVVATYHLPAGRYFIDRYKMRMPVLGPLFQYSMIVFFSKTLSMLINSGVSIIEALKATRETIGNLAVKNVIDRMVERVMYGENLSDPLLEPGSMFPPMVGNMVKVGEETGGIDSSLLMVADIYGKLLETSIKRMITMIEPFLLVVLGGMVGFIAVSLIGAILASYGA